MGAFAIMFVGVIVALIYGIAKLSSMEKEKITKTDIRNRLVSMISQTFSEIGWTDWPMSTHSQDEQLRRLERAVKSKKISVVSYDKEKNEGIVSGDNGALYTVGAKGCSCPDFNHRGLPCKHMYFLAIYIGEKPELLERR